MVAAFTATHVLLAPTVTGKLVICVVLTVLAVVALPVIVMLATQNTARPILVYVPLYVTVPVPGATVKPVKAGVQVASVPKKLYSV